MQHRLGLHYTTVTVKSCWRLRNAIWRRLIFLWATSKFPHRHCGILGNAGLVRDDTIEEGLKVENVKLHVNVRNVEGRLPWWLACGLRSFGKSTVEEKMTLTWSDGPETFFHRFHSSVLWLCRPSSMKNITILSQVVNRPRCDCLI